MKAKKFLALLLSLVMALGCMSVTALADDPTIAVQIAAAGANAVIEIPEGTFEIPSSLTIPEGVTLKGAGADKTALTITTENGDGVKITNPNVKIQDVTINGANITSVGYNSILNVEADGVVIDNVVMTGGGMSTWNASILVETLTANKTFTVKNSTISGSFRGVLRESCNANIVIDSCNITATYPFNIDGGNAGTVTVNNSSLHGWTSYNGVDYVVFNNTQFSKASYDIVAAYVDTTFTNCVFDADFQAYAQTSPFTWKFLDCTKNGTPLTKQNFMSQFEDKTIWTNCTLIVDDVPYNSELEKWAVAKVDGAYYFALDDAAAAATVGSTITVLEDMTIDSGSFPCAVVADEDVTISITGGTFTTDPSAYVAEGYVANKLENNKYVVTKKVELDTETETLEVKDEVTGVEVSIDTSAGSAMKEIFNDADSKIGTITGTNVVGDNTETTTITDVDLTILVEDKSDSVPVGGISVYEKDKIVAVYDFSVQKMTTTETVTTNTATGAQVGDPVVDTTTETVPYTGGSIKVTIPYDKSSDAPNTVYSVVYYNDGTGETEVMDATYDSVNKCFVFYTTHFSTYLVYGEPFDEANVANAFTIALKPVSAGTNVNEYQIILSADSDKVINRFTSADLTFSLTGTEGKIVYRDGIAPNSVEYIKLNDSLRSADRFEFYVNGNNSGTEYSDITAKSIILGTITFGGYGTNWAFEITKAVINTTTLTDNIVVTTSETGGVTLDKSASTTFASPTAKINPLTLTPETKDLTVNITFPNTVKDNPSAYQDMTLTVSGGDLTSDIVHNLGDANYTAAVSYPYFTTVSNPMTADKYTVELTGQLTKNVMYTVTVTGAGYRSTRYNVLMTGDKTLTFWNNVMDNDTVIETGNDATKVKVTYLAGDIVQDAQINIYDLSAVVSYFGAVNTTSAASDYAKYDLNRDGKIDSIDVAYVLVSWGK